ncbi:MAG: hypothetical protein HUU20_01615 [Pirellulales bacterium]|nr:hypothetical protein [Pirellulales bacterium]
MNQRQQPPLNLNSVADVVRWVIDELGALCPSPERLAAYSADPQAVEHRDIRYHVEEARCGTCRADLEAAAAKQQ